MIYRSVKKLYKYANNMTGYLVVKEPWSSIAAAGRSGSVGSGRISQIFHLKRFPNRDASMVLILDGDSETGAHLSNLCHLIC